MTDYDLEAPLHAIRRLMLESNGLIAIAFKRTYIEHAVVNRDSDFSGREPREISDEWMTTPWPHIESAMAYQLGLPVLILREAGVIADGVLEKGVAGIAMPEFDLSKDPTADFMNGVEGAALFSKWAHQAESVFLNKGSPGRLY
ncbi:MULTISPECIES: hypothetical protein [unclassified Nocardiopsis]|uniref:hypothetical protein n=1 Tax=Nocardiopsis TaxID=2013 RepID=UPI00387B55D5